MTQEWDVLVVGGGHAGIEAAAAAARLGARTALVTLEPDAVGRMSCNPAIGGIGKGQLAREVDALGGLMGRITDAAGIQFRLLNTSKGRAVQSPRAQCERPAYERIAQEMLAEQGGVDVIGGEAVAFLWQGERLPDPQQAPDARPAIRGLRLADGRELAGRAVVLTTGTFLEGVLHTGLEKRAGGRHGEAGAARLGEALRALGLPTARMKTGTPPRLASDSVDYAAMQEQPGDAEPVPFSFLTSRIDRAQVSCWLTSTTPETHAIVRANLDQAPMYAGRIEGVGPRYCPSLEDKVVRFADKQGHTVFLEPEGVDSPLLYANGISTSLPAAVQREFVRTCVGMERAEIVQPGYAVEYTHVAPRCLRRTLELRDWPGLYLAGQICGTSGYEEAAAQGIVAGINAAAKLRDGSEFLLGRHQGYIGVLVDDLVVSDPSEPYRMFTSRADRSVDGGARPGAGCQAGAAGGRARGAGGDAGPALRRSGRQEAHAAVPSARPAGRRLGAREGAGAGTRRAWSLRGGRSHAGGRRALRGLRSSSAGLGGARQRARDDPATGRLRLRRGPRTARRGRPGAVGIASRDARAGTAPGWRHAGRCRAAGDRRGPL
jgi:tRNA uridine 5-carboxymethylaminomethyl modification enzyme